MGCNDLREVGDCGVCVQCQSIKLFVDRMHKIRGYKKLVLMRVSSVYVLSME